MLLITILVFIVLNVSNIVSGRVIDTDTRNDVVAEVVAQCRLSCVEKFIPQFENVISPITDCQEQSNCSMCWDFCQFLHLEKREVVKSVCQNIVCVSLSH